MNCQEVIQVIQKELLNLKEEIRTVEKTRYRLHELADYKFTIERPGSSRPDYEIIGDTIVFPKEELGKPIVLREDSCFRFLLPFPAWTPGERQQIAEVHTQDVPLTLDEYQAEVFRQAIQHDYTLVFGPPGSGKTYTIAKICEHLRRQGEKVLMTAIANLAVDNILRFLPEDQRLKVGSAEYQDLVTSLRKEKEEILEKIKSLKVLRMKKQNQRLFEKRQQLQTLEEQISNLRVEIARKENSLFRFLLRGKVAAMKETLAVLSEKHRALSSEKERIESEIAEFERELQDLIASENVQMPDEKYSGYSLEQITYEINALESRVKKINAEIVAAMDRASFLGITLYKLLDLVHRQRLHLAEYTVVVDEASQVPYPVIFYLRALAKRVVAIGDPNQLPPITNTGIPSVFALEPVHAELKKVRRFKKEVGKVVTSFYDRELEVILEGGRVSWAREEDIDDIVSQYTRSGVDYMIATPYVERKKAFLRKGYRAGTIHELQGKEYHAVIVDIPKDSNFVTREMIIVALTRTKEELTVVMDLERDYRNPHIQMLKLLVEKVVLKEQRKVA